MGDPIIGCGLEGCGDGECGDGEDCAVCPGDCNPLPPLECVSGCSPSKGALACEGNHACVPAAADPDAPPAAGVCADGCAGPEDCAQGVCVLLNGLSTAGVCGAACDPDGSGGCEEPASCISLAGGGGACLVGLPCEPGAAETCFGDETLTCVPTSADPTAGVCLLKCLGFGCQALPSLGCVAESTGAPIQGQCVGQADACSLSDQTCDTLATCSVLGGSGIGGYALVCLSAAGEVTAGGDCSADQDACQATLACVDGVCRSHCDLADPICAAGICTDVGAKLGAPAGIAGACIPGCGDTICDDAESCLTCPEDCETCADCGDGECIEPETCGSCAEDCGVCAACGDGECLDPESCGTCPADCGVCECGNDVCEAGETCEACPEDCGPCFACGNEACEEGESCVSCPLDCGACKDVCGDSNCTGLETCSNCEEDCGACLSCGDGGCFGDEDCQTCPQDCGACVCSNMQCDGDETCETCAQDCGACPPKCGDETCSPGESCFSCVADCGECPVACEDGICVSAESCETCPQDCGACPDVCGDEVCGEGESCETCQGDCGVCPGSGPCDPTLGSVACAGNYACDPDVEALDELLFEGSGVCGAPCQNDGDCQEGGCVAVEGLPVPAVCATPQPCDPSAFDPCDAPLTGFTACLTLAADPTSGVCVDGCFVQDPAACAAGPTCLGKTDPLLHQGTCFGQDDDCDPIPQTGCAADATCSVFGGFPSGGQALMCVESEGALAKGEACSFQDFAPCAPGLLCHDELCTDYCQPGGDDCAGGACVDISASLFMPADQIGVCQ